jgi:hypothetical protein
MLSQRIYGLALGYEDINDHEQLRKDPVFGVLAGLLLGFSACAYSGPIAITGGSFNLSPFEVSWSLVGEGFSASGADDYFTTWCGFCFAPFQLNVTVSGPYKKGSRGDP